jgi:hypothetical protein
VFKTLSLLDFSPEATRAALGALVVAFSETKNGRKTLRRALEILHADTINAHVCRVRGPKVLPETIAAANAGEALLQMVEVISEETRRD